MRSMPLAPHWTLRRTTKGINDRTICDLQQALTAWLQPDFIRSESWPARGEVPAFAIIGGWLRPLSYLDSYVILMSGLGTDMPQWDPSDDRQFERRLGRVSAVAALPA